jgi:hypothetical protein
VDRLDPGKYEVHRTACLEFAPNAGLWFVAEFAGPEARLAWEPRVVAAVRLLADSGFGGRRSIGWGHADIVDVQDGSLAELVLGTRRPPEPPPLPPPAPVPVTTEPITEPVQAAVIAPPAIEPLLLEPIPVPPSPIEPAPDEPSPVEPAPPEPGSVESAPAESAPAEPPSLATAPVELTPVEPASAEPTPSAPASTEPKPDEPTPVEPTPTEPTPTEPAPTEPAPPEPTPTEPAPIEPTPAEPPPAEPAPVTPLPELPPEPLQPVTPSLAAVETADAAAAAAPAVAAALPTPTPTAWWLISVYAPAPEDAIEWTRGAYSLITRSGRVDSPHGAGQLKKTMRMVEEGSLLFAPSAPRGLAADVSPDGFPHSVFRAGYAVALPVPFRGHA